MASIWEFIVNIVRRKNNDATEAKDRLQMVLVQDRVKITPEAMEEMKSDLIATLSDYLEIDSDQFEIKLTREGKQASLIANIPVKGGRAEIVGKHKQLKQDKVSEQAKSSIVSAQATPKTPKKVQKTTKKAAKKNVKVSKKQLKKSSRKRKKSVKSASIE